MGDFKKTFFAGIICLFTLFGLKGPTPQAATMSLLLPGPSNDKQETGYLYQRSPSTKRVGGLPLNTFTSAHFVGSGLCANCHDLLRDSEGNDMSIANHWRSTMMANASKDPLWLAKVASEVDRNPAIKSVIEKKCATCHMPMAYTESNSAGSKEPAIFQEGFLNKNHQLHELAMDGVSCALCHQIQDRNLGKKDGFSGKFTVETSLGSPDRPIFGPYKYPLQKAMRTSIGFTPEYGSQVNTSELCASCHTLYTPYLDADGNIAGEFPEQTPYLEWSHSLYAKSTNYRRDIGEKDPDNPAARICQECHMPHSPGGPVMIARYSPPQTQPKEHFSQHHFVGGNALMLDLFQENASLLGITSSSKYIEATRQRTITQLQKDTAELAIVKGERRGSEVEVALRITSKVGHKFPTGFPSRRTWLHLQVLSEEENVLFESGRPLSDGAITGNDNDLDPYSFEPHYDVITSGDQVQIYETIMHNTDKEITYTLLRAAGYLKDNRLLPEGFDKKTASQDIAVFGEAAGDDNFNGGTDTVTYKITLPDHTSRITVRAALLYSPLSSAFLKDLMLDDGLNEVRRFAYMLDRIDKLPVLVATAETAL